MKYGLLSGMLIALPWVAGMAAAHPLDGRIWNTHTRRFIDAGEAYRQASASRHVLLGERHDSVEHHRLQLEMLHAVSERGRRPALAMEQFDREHQPALDAAGQAAIKDAEILANAGRLNRKGWRWPMYKALIEHAAERGWPIVAANLSRAEAREIVLGQREISLPSADGTQITAMEADIANGHCGQRPPPEQLARFVAAQRARDLAMANATPGKDSPADYDPEDFDLLWFTPPTARPDPCVRPLDGTVSSRSDKP